LRFPKHQVNPRSFAYPEVGLRKRPITFEEVMPMLKLNLSQHPENAPCGAPRPLGDLVREVEAG
jgi:hypothetical protein